MRDFIDAMAFLGLMVWMASHELMPKWTNCLLWAFIIWGPISIVWRIRENRARKRQAAALGGIEEGPQKSR